MHTFQSRVRYSEVTSSCLMDLYSVLNYFQDCSNFHSADAGAGIDYLRSRHRVWLLSSWQIEIVDFPKLFEHITVGTWPYDFKGFYGYRNFILYNDNEGHKVSAYANSVWFLMDTDTMKPVRIGPEDSGPYALEPAYPMEYAPRKITLPSAGAPFYEQLAFPEIPVSRTLLDSNNHVNNGEYVRLAESCLPEDFIIRGMRAEYRRAAVLGDRMHPVLMTSPDGKLCYVALNDSSGQAFAVIEFHA